MMASTQLGFRIQIEATNSHALDPAQKKKKKLETKPSMSQNYSKKIDIIMKSNMLARLVSEMGQKEGKERW